MPSVQVEDKTLEKIKNIIISTVSPDRIVLFGSRTKQQNTKDSDYDILVLKKNISNERIICRKINHALFKRKINVPVDIIALDTEKWEEKRKIKGLIFEEISESGIVLYE